MDLKLDRSLGNGIAALDEDEFAAQRRIQRRRRLREALDEINDTSMDPFGSARSRPVADGESRRGLTMSYLRTSGSPPSLARRTGGGRRPAPRP